MRIAAHTHVQLTLVMIAVCSVSASAQVVPTSEWVSLWSDASTMNNQPVPANTVIRVYDPDGVLCGETVVTTSGSYGLVPVYRDDPLTTSVDEGAEPGDTLIFTLDSIPARPLGPDAPRWTQNGEILRVDLAAERVVPTSEWVSFWSDMTRIGDTPIAPGAVVRAYDPSGVLCGEFATIVPGGYGLMAVYRDDPTTAGVDEGADPGDVITFTVDGAETTVLGPDLPMWTANGHVRRVDLYVEPVSTFVVAATVQVVHDVIVIEWTLALPVESRQLTLLRQLGGSQVVEKLAGVAIEQRGASYRAVDTGVEPGLSYIYWLRVEGIEGPEFLELGTARIDPLPFDLSPGYPNPFRHRTTLQLDLEKPALVTFAIYDAAGRLVRRTRNGGTLAAGRHEVVWDGLDDSGNTVPAGVYFVRVQAGRFRQMRKVTLLR